MKANMTRQLKALVLKKIILAVALLSCGYRVYAQNEINEKPFILGKVLNLHSAALNEDRILNVYLPDGYDSNDTARYPVIYLLDGGADEDFIHIVGLVQFNSFEWINRLPKTIVVGIANVDRKRDFTYPTTLPEDIAAYPTAGHSDKFIAFLKAELIPFIDKKYKTTTAKTLIGESLGGLLATEILLKQPNLFSQYIIVSPSLWWDNGSLLRLNPVVPNVPDQRPVKVYIGVGKEGVWPAKIPHVMEVDANLLADKLRESENKRVAVYFDYLPQENHATISHQAVFNAFRLLYAAKGSE
jgi:predicted alpha/beta superfamily hydrolase